MTQDAEYVAVVAAMAEGIARSHHVGVLWRKDSIRKQYEDDARAALAGLLRAGYQFTATRIDGIGAETP